MTQPAHSDNAENAIDRRMALAREWDQLVEEVRRIDGFENFLKPPPLKTLLPAASDGPIAVINVSRWRCDALIVTKEGVRVCPLPKLNLEAATDRAARYLDALRSAESATEEYRLRKEEMRRKRNHATIASFQASTLALSKAVKQADDMLHDTQAWLWDVIAGPVLDELGYTSALSRNAGDDLQSQEKEEDTWPRMWWCPTGPLTLLPLHAAGYHREQDGLVPRTVLDRVVSSYTPTLRALLEAKREHTVDTHLDRNRLLIVALEKTPGQPPLEGAATDLSNLSKLFPDTHKALHEDAATRAAVLGELPRHRWVHFACHGDQDLNQPSEGALVLYDGRLTVADISTNRFHGDFAGLAACKTAVGGVNLLDEVITLAAALHYTGYRHVVASLWSVHDTTTSDIFATVYAKLAKNGQLRFERSATALHRAVLAARDRHLDAPRQWTPFTHTGP